MKRRKVRPSTINKDMNSKVLIVCVLALVVLVEVWIAYWFIKPKILATAVHLNRSNISYTIEDLKNIPRHLLSRLTGTHTNTSLGRNLIGLGLTRASSAKTQQTTEVFNSTDTSTGVHTQSSLPSTIHSSPPHSGIPLISWRKGTFCEDFLERTFTTPVPICGSSASPHDSVQCSWNPKSAHMATCTLRNVVIRPRGIKDAMDNADKCYIRNSNSIWLMDQKDTHCPSPTGEHLARTMEGGDYVKLFIDELVKVNKKGPSVCKKWVNETVFFFGSHVHHIYFRFLAWFNVHKMLLDHHVTPGHYRIIRISGGKDYLFPEYEKKLFPGLITWDKFPDLDTTTCFREVVLVPKCYATIQFQCKLQPDVRPHCLGCNGRGLTGTMLMSFRRQVLEACSIRDPTPDEVARRQRPKNLVVIMRKTYHRFPGDSPHNFQRVLTNQEELITKLRTSFPSVNVSVVYMEDIPICDQIRYAHSADVLMGVHGAGLVHLWWLREDALMFELEPYFQRGNPSFRVLSMITGRRYHSHGISGSNAGVTADVSGVIEDLRSKAGL